MTRKFAVAILVLLFALPSRAETPKELPSPGNLQSGSLLLHTARGVHTQTALDTDVTMAVSGLTARVAVRQRFENRGEDWAEGVYVFPLPDSAAVNRMRLHIGERFIEGEIREKEEAKKEYEAAREAGQRASLVEQERPNLFTTSVANIAPGETIVVEIEYLEELRYDAGEFSLRFPLTLTPRYMPGAALPDRQGSGWSPDTTAVPDASRISPPMAVTAEDRKVSIAIELDAGLPLASIVSRYHEVIVSERQDRYRVMLAAGEVPMDHDFELTWQPATGHAPQALLFHEDLAGDPYYLLMVMPPDSAPLPAPPREALFIIDTSGSMHGTSIGQARAALVRALDGLAPGDTFNVIAFSDTARPLFRRSTEVSPTAIATAQRFVQSLDANGGTEMRGALELALRDPAPESQLRQLVFITDGAVGNEEELFALIEEKLGSGRLFTIGIGSAPNSWFMRKAAETGRGSYTMISALAEVGEKMDRLFAKIGRPQVTDIRIDWPGGVIVEAFPKVVPDLYAGEPVSVRAKLSGELPQTGTVLVSGNTAGGAWRRELSLAPGLPSSPGAGVAALWARARIESLLDEGRRGRDEAEVKQDVVATALEHHLVSRHTSLVAVDKTPARVAERLRQDAIANRLPYGQDFDAIFGFPATATNATALMLGGMAAMLAAMLLLLSGRGRGWSRVASR